MHIEELKLNNKLVEYYALIIKALENSSLLTSISIRTKALAKKRARYFLDIDLLVCNRTSTLKITN
jgi:hypothetical protein